MADMKTRHAAALALIGWYLLVPPPVIHSSVPVNLDAPLLKWGIFSTHDSAAKCEQTLVAFYKLAKTELVANPADERYRIRFYQLEALSASRPMTHASRKNSARPGA